MRYFTGQRELYPIAQDRYELLNQVDQPHNSFVRDTLDHRLDQY